MTGGSRKTHTKSRNGCGQCKKRHVRCDGRPPCCIRCEKSGLQCDYYAALGISPSPSSSSYDASFALTSSGGGGGGATEVQMPPPTASISVVPSMISALTPGITYPELDLLHHYAVSTYKTLGARPIAQNGHYWKHAVPQAAQSHAFLMHNLLALSALHVAYLDPRQRPVYYEIGVAHYNKGLQLYRPSTGFVAPENVHAIVASGLLVFIVLMGMPLAAQHKSPDSLESLMHPFVVLRRTSAYFYAVCKDPTIQAQLGFTYEYPLNFVPELSDPVALQALATLRRFNQASQDPEEHKRVYGAAIIKLATSYAFTGLRPTNWSRMMFWPRNLPPEFYALAQQRKPMALLLFAFWSVPIYHVYRVWFIGDWGTKMILTISAMMPEPWKPAMQWPLAEIGMLGTPENGGSAYTGYLPSTPAFSMPSPFNLAPAH